MDITDRSGDRNRFFTRGLLRIVYYFMSFIAPSFVEDFINQSLSENFLTDISRTVFPLLYIAMTIIEFVITPIFNTFLFQGIILHRWAAKWGTIKAIFALCFLGSILTYPFIIYWLI
jgi:hypothetical protein